jgi:hypothetical protein
MDRWQQRKRCVIFTNTWLYHSPELLLALDSGHRLRLKHSMLQTLLALDLSLPPSQSWHGLALSFCLSMQRTVFPLSFVFVLSFAYF